MNDGFISIVVDEKDPTRLIVRARRKKDLLNLVGTDAPIVERPDRAYRYGTFIGREEFKILIAHRIDQIEYSHFTDSVKDHDLQRMYLDFWSILRRYQR